MVAIARTLVYDSMLGDASPPSLLARVSTRRARRGLAPVLADFLSR